MMIVNVCEVARSNMTRKRNKYLSLLTVVLSLNIPYQVPCWHDHSLPSYDAYAASTMTDLVTMTLTFRYRRFSFNQVTRVESVRQIRVSLRLFYTSYEGSSFWPSWSRVPCHVS